MGFVKIHDALLDSSIVEADPVIRWVWVAMLIKCNRYGQVYGTDAALARRFNVTPKQLGSAFDILASPDPNSTTKDEDGRRIVRIDTNLWQIVNYTKYRGMKDPEEEREKTRMRVAKHRATKGECNACNADVTKCNDIAEAEAEAEAEADTHSPSRDGRRGAIQFDEFWNLYPRKDAKKKAYTAWCNLTVANQQTAIAALPHHVTYWTADGRTRKTTPLPTTWINGERWVDEIDVLGGTRSAHADEFDADGNPK